MIATWQWRARVLRRRGIESLCQTSVQGAEIRAGYAASLRKAVGKRSSRSLTTALRTAWPRSVTRQRRERGILATRPRRCGRLTRRVTCALRWGSAAARWPKRRARTSRLRKPWSRCSPATVKSRQSKSDAAQHALQTHLQSGARRWPAQSRHPVQDVAGNQRFSLLRFGMTSREPTPDDQLVSEERVLHASLRMITGLLLPPPSPNRPHSLDRPIAGGYRGLRRRDLVAVSVGGTMTFAPRAPAAS